MNIAFTLRTMPCGQHLSQDLKNKIRIFYVSINSRTIQGWLVEAGLPEKRPAKRLLTQKREAKLLFILRHRNWTERDWKKSHI